MPILYSMKKLFKGDPKTTAELRDTTISKLSEFKLANFAFTMSTKADKQPALVISWDGTAVKKKYWPIAAPADPDNLITGTLVPNKKAKAYELTVDSTCQGTLSDYLRSLPALSIALYNLMEGSGVTLITVNGKVLTQRQLKDSKLTICEWNLTRVLSVKGLFDKAPLSGKEVTVDKSKLFVMDHGVSLASQIMLKVEIHGLVAEKALENAHLQQFLRDDLADVMRTHTKKLAEKLIEIDTKDAPKDKDPQKAATSKKVSDAVESFMAEATDAIEKSFADNWMTYLEAHVDYRDFKIDCTVQIFRGAVGVTLGITSAVVGGISGVGAVLGLVGTIKGTIELGATVYRVFRDVKALGNELNEALSTTLLAYAQQAGWRDLARDALGRLPGIGPITQLVAASMKTSIKPVSALKADLKTYNDKVAGLLEKAKKLAATVEKVLADSENALNALDAPAVKAAEAQNPELKKSNAKKRELIGKLTTDFLNKIGDLTGDFREGKKKSAGYGEIMTQLEGNIAKDKVAVLLTKYFAPLLDAPWGIDPDDLVTTLMTAGTTVMDLANSGLQDLKVVKDGDRADNVTEWAKFGNDSTNSIIDIMKSLKRG